MNNSDLKGLVVVVLAVIIIMFQYYNITKKIYDIDYNSFGNDQIKSKMHQYLVGKSIGDVYRYVCFKTLSLKKNKAILLYSVYDCSSCIDKGMQISKYVLGINNSKEYYIVASNGLQAQDKLKQGTEIPRIYDEDGRMKKMLKYVYTPVLLFINSNNNIDDAIFINNHMSELVLKKIKIKINNYIKP